MVQGISQQKYGPKSSEYYSTSTLGSWNSYWSTRSYGKLSAFMWLHHPRMHVSGPCAIATGDDQKVSSPVWGYKFGYIEGMIMYIQTKKRVYIKSIWYMHTCFVASKVRTCPMHAQQRSWLCAFLADVLPSPNIPANFHVSWMYSNKILPMATSSCSLKSLSSKCLTPRSKVINWLVVWNPLKNISQLGWLFPI